MFVANYLVLLPNRITLTGTLWLNRWRVSHINIGMNWSAFLGGESSPTRCWHHCHCFLQDSGCDNIEKHLTAESTDLQKSQQLLRVPSSRAPASSIKAAASLVCCKRPSAPPQISASQPTEGDITGPGGWSTSVLLLWQK